MENFVEKSADELAKMDGLELAGYYKAYNEADSKKLRDLVEAKASKEEIAELKTKLDEVRDAQYKEMNTKLSDMGLALKKVTEQEAKNAQEDSFGDILRKNWDDVSKALNGGSKFTFKAPATMTIAGNVSGGNVPVEQRIAGLDTIASRRIRLLDIVSRGTATSNVISWVSQANKDGAAAGTAEGTLKNQIDFDLVVDSENVKKFTAFIKVSDEMKDDISFMESELNNELSRELIKVIETQVYEGDDSALQLNGIRTVATAFAAGTFATSIDNANIVDVLRVAMNQILIADHDPATFVLMHPSDVTFLKTKKVGSTDERYINQLQDIAGQLLIDGVPIIATTLVTQDEYLVGNFALATVWDKGSINIEMGLDSDDFTKNLMTLRAEWRGAVVVKTNERSAFIKGDFTTDKAALETP